MVIPFVEYDAISWVDLCLGIKRKMMTYDDRAMLVMVAFEEGVVGILHYTII